MQRIELIFYTFVQVKTIKISTTKVWHVWLLELGRSVTGWQNRDSGKTHPTIHTSRDSTCTLMQLASTNQAPHLKSATHPMIPIRQLWLTDPVSLWRGWEIEGLYQTTQK